MSSGAGPSTSQAAERASDILRVPDENHQLSRVLQNEPQTLNVRGHQRHVRTHARCRDMLLAMGLYQLSELKTNKTDPAIITALVERYRSETHCFNMPTGKNCKFISSISFYLFCTGEITPTLQDVAVLYGLPISGPPVTGHSDTDHRLHMQRAFGVGLPAEAFKQKSVGPAYPDGTRRHRTSYYAVRYAPFLINIIIYNFGYVMKLGLIELF